MNELASFLTFISILLILFPIKTVAQLIPDNSLNNENSRIINGIDRDLIDGGARRGINLFHSFQEFNVNLGQTVYFVNPSGVSNILTRVTGVNPSNIFGTLGVEGNANLFLINPNGIRFGTGANLDLNGAFIGTTAAEIQLGNTGNFSAIAPDRSNLLAVNPSALFFNALAQNQIAVTGDLRVNPGQTIGLFAGNILVDGGRIEAPSGQIFLNSVNSGTVNLDINNNRIDNSLVNSFGDITITGRAKIRANTENLPGKGIEIAANNLLINGGSELELNTSGNSPAGTLNIDAKNIEISGGFQFTAANGDRENDRTQITANVGENATGTGGNINIKTDRLRILNSARIRANTNGIGNAGTINITANNLVEVSGFVTLRLADGNIDRESSTIATNVNSGATGNGGKININSNIINVSNRGDIVAQTSASGNGGTIDLRASLIEVKDPGSDIRADINETATGRGGKIIIHTDTLRVSNQADIQARTRGSGNARDPALTTRDPNNPQDYSIFIKANNLVEITGAQSDIRATVSEGATGNGGNIAIDTDTLRISDRGDIQLDSRGAGNGGSLDIFARAIELRSGGGIENDVGGSIQRFNTTGNSGDINITTDILSITNSPGATNPRSEIAIDNFGLGDVGTLTVTANFVNLDNGFISSRTQSPGSGGDIILNIRNLLTLRNGSEIRTNSLNVANRPPSGNGGNITINSPFIVAFPENNAIIAGSESNNGGRIGISTINILGFPQFVTINADSGVGIDGTVNIDTADTSPGSILRQLESTPIDATAIIASDLCRLEGGKIAGGSSFVITGKGGLPPTPITPINSSTNLLDWVDIPENNTILENEKNEPVIINDRHQKTAEKKAFIAAKGWLKRADGKIILTSNSIPGNYANPNLVPPHCSQ